MSIGNLEVSGLKQPEHLYQFNHITHLKCVDGDFHRNSYIFLSMYTYDKGEFVVRTS